jgi:hypothetical protein
VSVIADVHYNRVKGIHGSMYTIIVFLNSWAATRYRALASVIPGPPIIKKKNFHGRGLTKFENYTVGYRNNERNKDRNTVRLHKGFYIGIIFFK